MKRIFLIYMILCCSLSVEAQNITRTFKNQSLSKVLTSLRDVQNEYAIHFIHNDLEHLPVTATLKDLSVPEAVERICKGLPVRVKVKGTDIFVQYKDKSKVRTMLLQGKVLDSRTHNELPGAMVYLLSKDSTVIDSCHAQVFFQSDDKSWYSSDFHFNIPQAQATYIFKARMGGYETGYMEYTISNLHRREFNRQLPPLYLLEVGRMLKEVTVTASQVMFYHRGDTVVYNASAFQLAEGNMLDALVKQLPGVELKSDGRIYHNGKFVESLLLNGKEFFKGDNRVMLDNLPAYTVKQIEFYDKYGEKSEFLGQQLEADKGYVMNVKLKKEYSIGYLANIEVGGGPSFGEVNGDDAPQADERYLARLFAMRFTDHSRVAIYANANNLNDETRPGEDNNWNQRQSDETGRATQQQGGIDYNVDARNKKWNVQGNTRLAHSKRDLQTTTHRTNFLPSGDTYERSRSMADDRSFSLNTWNQFRYNFPKVQLTFTPDLAYTHTDNRSQFLSTAFTETDDLINTNRQQGILRGHEFRAAFAAKATVKIEHSSDYYELETNMNYRTKDDDRFNRQQVTGKSAFFTDQYFKNHPDRYQNIGVQGLYHWAIKQNMRLDATLSYEHRDTRREQSLYLLDRLNSPTTEEGDPSDGMADDKETGQPTFPSEGWRTFGVLPSVADYERTMDIANSYDSHLGENYYAAHPIFWWFPKSKGGKWSISLRLPMRVQNRRLHYQRGRVDTTIVRTPFLVSSEGNYAQWRSNNGKYNVFIQPVVAASAPELRHFVDIRDATDPLNIHLGNNDLGNTYRYSLKTHVTKMLQEKQILEGVSAEFRYTQNELAMSHLYDPTTGVHTYQPFSVDGNWHFRSDAVLQLPLDRPKRLFFGTGASFTLVHSVDLTGTTTLERSTVNTTGWVQEVNLSYKFNGQNNVKLAITPTWQWFHSRREDFQDFRTTDIKSTLTALLALPWKMQLSTDLTLYSRRGYRDASMNDTEWCWNARLSRPFFNGKFLLMLDGFDLLNQLSNITQTINAQGRTETWTNTLHRYVLLHAAWRINHQPKKRN